MEIFNNYFHNLAHYKGIRNHPSYHKFGKGWTAFYYLRPFICAYFTWRIGKLLIHTIKKQWNGDHNFDETIMKDEIYLHDLFRDSKDYIAVNFRYSDHVDTRTRYSHFNPDVLKADADYAKGLISYFRSTSQI